MRRRRACAARPRRYRLRPWAPPAAMADPRTAQTQATTSASAPATISVTQDLNFGAAATSINAGLTAPIITSAVNGVNANVVVSGLRGDALSVSVPASFDVVRTGGTETLTVHTVATPGSGRGRGQTERFRGPAPPPSTAALRPPAAAREPASAPAPPARRVERQRHFQQRRGCDRHFGYRPVELQRRRRGDLGQQRRAGQLPRRPDCRRPIQLNINPDIQAPKRPNSLATFTHG